MTVKEVADKAYRSLAPRFGEGEARWMVRLMMEEFKNYSPVDMAVRGDFDAGENVERRIDETVGRLLNGEPIQYIFGKARFYGMNLKVTPDVLIPRPETEELVDLIVNDRGGERDLRVLDVCTGSGCIAIALARNLPFSEVDAIDISREALAVARENASELKAAVCFKEGDALCMGADGAEYDIIVSNPPYIAEHERAEMDRNVLEHEPALALFVPDADPLRFYIAIARYALVALKEQGGLYFEINPLYASDLAGQMKAMGWSDVSILPDMQKKNRFLIARL